MVDRESLYAKNEGNLIGKFIDCFKDADEESVEKQALYEGIQALMETKRG